MSDKEPSELQQFITQHQTEIAAMEAQMSKLRFTDENFDPETWLQERGL